MCLDYVWISKVMGEWAEMICAFGKRGQRCLGSGWMEVINGIFSIN